MSTSVTVNKQAVLSNPLIDQLPGIRIFKNCECKFVGCNEYFLKMTLIKKIADLQGKSDIELPWAHYADIYTRHEHNTMNGNTYSVIEPIIIDGIVKFLATNKYPWINDGVCIGTYANASVIGDKGLLQRIAIALNTSTTPKKPFLCVGRNPSNLSEKECDSLWLLAHGKTTKEIALILNISSTTVRTYLDRIKEKLNLTYKNELISYAHSINLHLELMPHLAEHI